MTPNSISIISNRQRISLSPEDILYVQLVGRQSVIHISGGKTYETYTTIDDLEQMLGSDFLRADRATLVSAKGIHTIGKEIELINGELLSFTHRRKRELKEQLRTGRRQIVQELAGSDTPARGKNTSSTMPAMTARPSHLPTLRWCSTRNVPPWTGSSATATRRWQRWKKHRWSSSLTTPSAASSQIWTPSGCGSTSARRCSVRRWRSQITARRSTQNSKSSVSQPFRDTAAVCFLTAGRSRRYRAAHRRME